MKKIFTVLAVLAFGTTAHAADQYSAKDSAQRQVIVASEPTAFSGAYAGVSVNWDRLDVENNTNLNWKNCKDYVRCGLSEFFGVDHDVTSINLPQRGFDGDGISGGVRAGYNFRIGRIYGGPVLSLDFGKVEAKDAFSVDGLDVEHRASIDWSGTLAGKLGVVVSERIGVYGLVGTTFADVDIKGTGKVDGETVGSYSGSELTGGLTYGAGVEVMITENLSVFGEWTRTEFGSVHGVGSALDCIDVQVDDDLKLDRVKAGLAYHF